ncbi:MAG: hypothetical protein O2955_16520 [Planctomycetota bacterium]|nr:hypothetical protein [Planctomycetota bacterium]MDA1214118.1 hypothetical protein [Planctomycetota bacterium]
MLMSFAVVSLMFLGFIALAYAGSAGLLLALYGLIGLLLLLSRFPPLIILWFFLFVIALACKGSNIRWKNYVLTHVLILLTLNAFGWYSVLQRIPDLQVLEASYQPTPVATLLPYEVEIDEADQEATSGFLVSDNKFVQQTNNEIWGEKDWNWKMRTRGLETLLSLHYGTVSEFQVANGFGSIRMGDLRPHRDYIEIPTPGPVKQPEWSPPPYDPDASPPRDLVFTSDAEIGVASANQPLGRDALAFHIDQIVNFANVSGFGYVDRESRQMIGFQSHGFRTPPKWSDGNRDVTLAYEVARLELVSLLKHNPPAVYLSDNLPSMEELKADSAPTRELDEFEQQAIGRLRKGEDLVVAEDQYGLRMVGALRAVDDCLQCHQGRVGKLLGGFTYRLKPVKQDGQDPAKNRDIPERQKPLS